MISELKCNSPGIFYIIWIYDIWPYRCITWYYPIHVSQIHEPQVIGRDHPLSQSKQGRKVPSSQPCSHWLNLLHAELQERIIQELQRQRGFSAWQVTSFFSEKQKRENMLTNKKVLKKHICSVLFFQMGNM